MSHSISSSVGTMSGKPMELPVVHAEVAAIHDDAEKYGNNTMNASDVREDATEVVLDIRDAHLAGGRSLKLAKDGHVSIHLSHPCMNSRLTYTRQS